ncbi:glutathione S-transferase family protein [Leptolyngbya sp. FACHB-36]|uniref:glutathione S-transferase family protein n=1 Tax=Leptolyngbya sp. FACHB-36 TaxID=2692808 RepID=UPI00168118AD|nr:glutathione S-transferase family protein [Leptolyngbya sp. FACHB-36]MBD2021493.1 glutathione S-transferase family protein [Leptolyngbya sp. FACHB-36]
MYRLYNFPLSGNCYKVRLLLAQLGTPFECVDINIVQQETRLPAFLQKNPTGKVPVLEIAPENYLVESNSILLYLSEGTDFLPIDRLERTEVTQWLFFEQYSLGANLSRPRFWISVTQQAEQFAPIIAYHQGLGNVALEVLEQQLKTRSFLVAERYTIADTAVFAYTHVAEQGGYDMSQFPAIQAWIKRVQAQPNFISIV